MEKTKVLIVEDMNNPIASMQAQLKDAGLVIQAFVNSAEKAFREIETNRPEVVLLDVSMKGKQNCFETARIIREHYNTPVVFMSLNQDKHLVEKSLEAGAYGLVFKPFDSVQLKASLDFALAHVDKESNLKTERDHYLTLIDKKNMKEFIFVRADYKLNKIRLSDVYYIEALKDYVVIITADNSYTTHATMKIMSRVLPPRDFVRIHRSYIVRLDKIQTIKYPDLTVEGKMKTIPIGGLYRKELYRRLNLI